MKYLILMLAILFMVGSVDCSRCSAFKCKQVGCRAICHGNFVCITYQKACLKQGCCGRG